MNEFDLGFNRKLRIWQNQEIAKISKFTNKDKIYQISNKTSDVFNQTLISELFIPRGGRNIYGLLGLKYTDGVAKNLHISVPIASNQSDNKFSDAILKEPVFIGIPDEYNNYIIRAMDLLVSSNKLNLSGSIEFCYGAYNQISSNGWVFEKLTSILLNCLTTGINNFNVQAIQKILDN